MTIFKHKILPGIFKIYKDYLSLGYRYTFVNLFTKEEYLSCRNKLTHKNRTGLRKKKTLNFSDFTPIAVR